MFLKVIRSHMAALSHTCRMLPSICILVLSFQFVAREAVSQCVDGVSLAAESKWQSPGASILAQVVIETRSCHLGR